jgi:hypothetical protein
VYGCSARRSSSAPPGRSPESQARLLSLTPEEIELLIEAVQLAKYPDKPRPKPSLDKFERLDLLKVKLQG